MPPAPDLQAASGEKAVIWYTPLRRETADKIVAAFRARYPINVVTIQDSDVRLAWRFRQANTGKGVKADVLQLTDPGVMADLTERGLLREAAVPNRLNVPPWLRDRENFWVAPYAVTAVLAYRRDDIEAGETPRTWRDLAKPQFRNRLVVPDPGEGGPAFYWAAAMAKLHGWKFLKELGRNSASMVPFYQADAQMSVSKKMVFVGLSGEDVWRVGQARGGVQLVVPQEGVPVVPAAAALPKDSPHPQAGALFLNFLLSPADGFYPVPPKENAPPGRIALEDLRFLQLPWKQTAQRGEDFYLRLRKSLKADARISVYKPPLNGRRGVGNETAFQMGANSGGPSSVGAPAPSHPCGWFSPKMPRANWRGYPASAGGAARASRQRDEDGIGEKVL
jgi:iron(III) transport system substrate-binding protein